MASFLKPWLFGALLVTGASAYRHPTPIVLPRDELSTSIDTADDPELERWLDALQRAPALTVCPASCTSLQESSDGWAVYPDFASLATCNETMLVDLAVLNDVENSRTKLALRACAADFSSDSQVFEADESKAAFCSTPNHVMINTTVSLATSVPGGRSSDGFSTSHLTEAGQQVIHYLSAEEPSCTRNKHAFAYSQSVIVGVFGGAEVHQHGLTAEVLTRFLEHAQEESISDTVLVQLCEGDGRGADYNVGVIASSAKNFALVQETVKTWTDGRCVSDVDGVDDWMKVTIRVPKADPHSANSTDIVEADDSVTPAHIWSKRTGTPFDLVPRADCRTTKVEAGDGCWALADRCGISQTDLVKYNPRANFCDTLVAGEAVCCSSGTLPETLPPGNSDGTCKTRNVVGGDLCGSLASKCGISLSDFYKANPGEGFCNNLAVGQPVCCTKGTLPDIRPKPKPDGYCFDYTIQGDDDCSQIGARNGLTAANLESFNKNTWGWNGCTPLYPGTKICLSTGAPPMPAPQSNAICGPTVPGTVTPPSGTNISTLNPCPLNACCNIWGNCGLTADFCTISRASSGAPGTSAPGKNGCIYNCGMDIIKGSAPATKINVAYFEAWNGNRECLHMDVDQIPKDRFSHIHFAFIDITPDFKINTTSVQKQFNRFKSMTGIKKIVSFGGWDFSNMPGTFKILREATKPANRATFVNNLLEFVKNNNLDGVDLDWEYPGAPDIPDIPPGNPEEGDDYYQTLISLKQQIGSGKTVSFAAPASFHYLKSFPMKKMGEAIDYVIYMTYDLHGQWDYDNKWTSPGCESGNCLRSHVNETETKDALAMITKAGVPSGKVVVGVSSYGRSFKMASAGCDGPSCQFTGTNRVSNAAEGRCTKTAGYISNAEIDEILKTDRVTRKWTDQGSNMLVYDSTEWVAYMDEDLKSTRASFYSSYNFAGTTDWAVDLQKFWGGSGGGGGGGGGEDDHGNDSEPYTNADYKPCTGTYKTFKELEDSKKKIPPHCMNKYILDVEIAVIDKALKTYKDLVDGGYDKKFGTYERYVKEQVPDQIDQFVGDKGDDYFTCKETKERQCCDDCTYIFCREDCNDDPECDGGFSTKEIDCPTNLRDNDLGLGSKVPNTTFEMDEEEKFFKDIYDEYGIEEGWLKFGKKSVRRPLNGCQYSHDVNQCIEDGTTYWYGYPMEDKVEIFDPKDLIGDGYDESKDLLERLQAFQGDDFDNTDMVVEGLSWVDMADAAVMPAISMEQAVISMDKVVTTANEIIKKEREAMILNFIGGLLFFIPVIGGAIGGAALAPLRGILSMIGPVGEAGLLVYGIVQDPDSAFMAIFGALAGAALGRGGFLDAAKHRRGMSREEITSLGGPVKDKLDTVDNLRSYCSIRS